MAEPHVRLAILVDVRGVRKRSRHTMEIEDAALPDVDEQSNVFLTPGFEEG